MNKIALYILIAIFAAFITQACFFDFYKCECKHEYYKTNLTRQEMKEALMSMTDNNKHMLFVPGDTSIMPYLIKFKHISPDSLKLIR